MMNNSVEIFLLALGLAPEEIKLYLALVQKGPLTALELSRNTGVNRTKVYRLIEKLQADGVIEEVVDEYRRLAKAIDTDALEILVKKQEARAAALRESFPSIATLITDQLTTRDAQTKVLFYRGQAGIARMIWHTLKARGGLLGYTYRSLDEIAGKRLAEKWQEEWVRRGLVYKGLYSDEYLASMRGKSTERVDQQPSSLFRDRYVPSSVLNINHQVDIYNDVVAYYNWHEGEVFGVEIYNQKIADTQRQLFDLAWNAASTTNRQ